MPPIAKPVCVAATIGQRAGAVVPRLPKGTEINFFRLLCPAPLCSFAKSPRISQFSAESPDMLVRNKMTPNVITASPDTNLADALKLTRGNRIRHLPVVENDRLVGLVTDRDLRLAMPPVWAS